MGSRRAVRRYLNGCFQEQTGLSGFDCLDRSRRGESDHRERLLASEAEVIEATIPQEPAMDTKNGRDNSPPEGEKPIIDQMTDLAAQAAGSLAETAVKAGAKKAKKAVARRLPGPVKQAAKTIARAAKAGAKSRATKATAKSRVAKARARSKKTVKKTAKKSSTRSAKTSQSKARRRTIGKKTATKVATKKARRRRSA
jgi:hypothetical protein